MVTLLLLCLRLALATPSPRCEEFRQASTDVYVTVCGGAVVYAADDRGNARFVGAGEGE